MKPSRFSNFPFAWRDQPNYAWWSPLLEILAVAVLTFLFVGVSEATFASAGFDTSEGSAAEWAGYLSVIVEIFAVLIAVRFVGRRPLSTVFATGQVRQGKWFTPALAYVLAFVIILVVFGTIGVYGYGSSWNHSFDGVEKDLPLVLAALLLAALAEEAVFRGVFFQAFTAWTKRPLVGAVIAGLAFVAMHPQAYTNPVAFAHYLVDALFYTALVVAFDSIWFSVAVHAAWNTVGTVEGFGIPISLAGTAAGWLALALAVIAVVLVFRGNVSRRPSVPPVQNQSR